MRDLTAKATNLSHKCESGEVNEQNNSKVSCNGIIGTAPRTQEQGIKLVENVKHPAAEQTGSQVSSFTQKLKTAGTIVSALWFLISIICFFGMESTITAEDPKATATLLAVQLLASLWLFGMCNRGILNDLDK